MNTKMKTLKTTTSPELISYSSNFTCNFDRYSDTSRSPWPTDALYELLKKTEHLTVLLVTKSG